MQQFAKKKNILKRSTKKYLEEALYKKLFKEGGEEQRVAEQLNQFLKSRKSAYKWEVGQSLKVLRSRKLYRPAIKVWYTRTVYKIHNFPAFCAVLLRILLLVKFEWDKIFEVSQEVCFSVYYFHYFNSIGLVLVLSVITI